MRTLMRQDNTDLEDRTATEPLVLRRGAACTAQHNTTQRQARLRYFKSNIREFRSFQLESEFN